MLLFISVKLSNQNSIVTNRIDYIRKYWSSDLNITRAHAKTGNVAALYMMRNGQPEL